jgi:hypothetical protein
MLRRKGDSLTNGGCTLGDEKEPMVFWAKRWSALEGKEAMVRFLGHGIVGLCCVGRGTA